MPPGLEEQPNVPAFCCSSLIAEAAVTTRSTYHTSLLARKARRRGWWCYLEVLEKMRRSLRCSSKALLERTPLFVGRFSQHPVIGSLKERVRPHRDLGLSPTVGKLHRGNRPHRKRAYDKGWH